MPRASTSLLLHCCICLSLAACAGGIDPTGAGGSSSTGNAGNGVAGSGPAGTTGQAGQTGQAGTTGAAGQTGVAGTTGQSGGGGTATGTAGGGGSGPAGTTGMAGRGGSSSGGSGAGTGGSGPAGAGGSGNTGNCTFTPTAMTSTKIPSVGIVTFTTTMTGLTSAKIDFGLTTSYGMTAPVDLMATNYRTLLLGMKASTSANPRLYHYRITGTNSSGSCSSGDFTLMSGNLANGLQAVTRSPASAPNAAGGFLITGQYQMNAGGSGSPAYILDADGDYVWWYSVPGVDVTGARMSYDGKYMWINKANVPSGSASVHRVSMDGLTDDNYSSQFTGQNHQLAILPDETVVFYAYGSNGCDDIKERSPSGMVKTVANSRTAAGTSGACHVNNIQYSPEDNTIVFSDLDHDNVVKVKRTGETVWVLGGPTNQFGSGGTWVGGQHGIHVLALDKILIFNNNSSINGGGGAGDGSIAAEYTLNLTAKTATRSWFWKASSPRIQNDIMGDVQRLPNGNTFFAASTKSQAVEVTSSGTVVQTWTFPTTFGYIEKRATLYGPPPR